ncbi:CAP domain-containing protein [Sphingobacterium sp. LRF_L2]|uniref:CAP domain-containing protein n=1 Tax=Sphingobacterium sp. LRF_L2 TaxID=3369421 RepID=UPI003F6036C5
MRIISIMTFFVCVLSVSIYAQRKNIIVDRVGAKEAYHYLLAFRERPQEMMRMLGIKFDASKVSKLHLNWDSDLAKTAEWRATDMAKRDYFEHSTPEGIGPNHYMSQFGYQLNKDWLKKKEANNFESIAANHPTAVDGVKAFIVGRNSPGFMHRKHVLGMDSWNGSLHDIGIGFVRVPEGSTYKTYLSVIIAKHDW